MSDAILSVCHRLKPCRALLKPAKHAQYRNLKRLVCCQVHCYDFQQYMGVRPLLVSDGEGVPERDGRRPCCEGEGRGLLGR